MSVEYNINSVHKYIQTQQANLHDASVSNADRANLHGLY